jgi:hypothetical protein
MIPALSSKVAEISSSRRIENRVVNEIVKYGTACPALQDPGGLYDALPPAFPQTLRPEKNRAKKHRIFIMTSPSF